MEVNKGEAERCRDMGAGALKQGNYARAVKLFKKSLGMYPLPGVEALLGQAERKLNGGSDSGTTGSTNGTRATNGSSSTSDSASSSAGRNAAGSSGASASSSSSRAAFTRRDSTASVNSSTTFATAATSTGADGRAYSQTQVDIVKKVLRAKEGGRGAHYRVLGIESDANESQIKKAYRKLALKLHPDKNSAPKADEAFKAVGLAYATLSDEQKRTIYDRYGDEDPDNRGGSSAGAGGMHFRRRGGARPGEVDPEDIFNMFFGGGPGGMGGMGGGPGFHVYSSGFGPGGVRFHQGGARPRGGGGARGQQQQQEPEVPGLGTILQFLPFFIIMLLSFFNLQGGSKENVYQTRYFSLTQQTPFINPMQTRLSTVKDIPYFVTDQFLRTYNRDRYQLAQVERLVERTYHQYLIDECKSQRQYQTELKRQARRLPTEARDRELQKARDLELSRCVELDDLFPRTAFNR